MNDLRQAAQQALDALEFANVNHWWGSLTIDKAITALRTALEQQQAEPVATHRITAWGHCGVCRHDRIPGEGCARQECPDSPQQQAEPVAQRSDGMPISKMERELRRMLCIERHGRSAYMDDGEASFCGDKYCRSIDYMRESVESIKQAWYDAGVKKLAGAQPEQQAEPVAWRAWFDADNGARWLFTLWPNEEQLDAQWEPLYTAPPQHKPLTDEQVHAIWDHKYRGWFSRSQIEDITRAIEAAHCIKEGI